MSADFSCRAKSLHWFTAKEGGTNGCRRRPGRDGASSHTIPPINALWMKQRKGTHKKVMEEMMEERQRVCRVPHGFTPIPVKQVLIFACLSLSQSSQWEEMVTDLRGKQQQQQKQQSTKRNELLASVYHNIIMKWFSLTYPCLPS